MTATLLAVLGIGLSAAALLIGAWALLAPGRTRLPMDRRRPGVETGPGILHDVAVAATQAIERAYDQRRPGTGVLLERAGVTMNRQDLTVLVIAGALAAAAVGTLLGGLLLGLLFAVMVPVLVNVRLNSMVVARQRKFADQLEDSLQLIASGLRAGHSLPQALAAVAREAEKPTSEEFARVINEARVGRDLSVALAEAGGRMNSEDFAWVTRAIAINREVGGNLAEVLDRVSHTIRERNQIRRQVKSLAAEGKLSGIILMLLPFGIAGFLLFSNPGYMLKFTESVAGYVMLVVAVVLLIVGGFWMKKTVSIKF